MRGRWRSPYSAGVWSLLVGNFLMMGGFFMLFPLLTVHLTQQVGFDVATVGLILGARQLVQQGIAPIGGVLADRVGYKPVMVAGYLVRTVGFLLFAVSSELPAVLAGAMIAALGGALFEPPARAALAHLTPEERRQDAYAAAGVAASLGQVVGPLVGALLLPVSFAWIGILSAAAFLVAGIQSLLLLPGGMRGELSGGTSIWSALGATVRDGDFARFTALLIGFFFLLVQVVITIPLLADRLAGPQAVAVVYAVHAGTSVLLQVPLSRWMAARTGPLMQIAIGMGVLGAAFVGYGLADSLAVVVVSTTLLALGTILVFPVTSTITARLAGRRGGAYFGVGSLALAVGGALGNGGGGLLMDLGARLAAPWLPWLLMSGVAFASAAGFVWLGRDARMRARLSLTHEPAAVVAG